MLSLIKEILEIKRIGPEYEQAAKWLSIKLRNHKIDDPEYQTDMKYGAYSYEAWTEVAYIMDRLNINFGNNEVEAVEQFIDRLKELKLIWIEW